MQTCTTIQLIYEIVNVTDKGIYILNYCVIINSLKNFNNNTKDFLKQSGAQKNNHKQQ